jgi:hypothetical protein
MKLHASYYKVSNLSRDIDIILREMEDIQALSQDGTGTSTKAL